MSSLHESSSVWLLSSSLQNLSLADPQLLAKPGFIRIPCFPKERYGRSRRSLHSRQLLYRKQRYSIPRPKQLVKRQVRKFNTLEHHPTLMNPTQAYQPAMPSFSTLPLEGSPDFEEFINPEELINADEAMYAPYITEEPISLMMEYDITFVDGDCDEAFASAIPPGTANTTSSGSSPSTSIHSVSTEGSMNTTYTSDSTDVQVTTFHGERSPLPTGSPTYETLSGPSGEVYFKCQCGKVIGHRRNIKRHEETCRFKKDKMRYRCEFCGETFARKDICVRHLKGNGKRGSACSRLNSSSEHGDDTVS